MNVLSQTALPAAVITNAYTTIGFQTVTGFILCNRANTQVTFRISLAPLGAADGQQQYIFFDTPILPNDTFITALEIELVPGDIIRAFASNENLSLTILGNLTFMVKSA